MAYSRSIIYVRENIETALTDGLLHAGLIDNAENRRLVLENVVKEFEETFEEISSVTEKLWMREYMAMAKDMIEELEKRGQGNA